MNGQMRVLNSIYTSILENNFEHAEALLKVTGVNPNGIVPDKGIHILHLSAGLSPEEYAYKFSELIVAHGGSPNERSDDGMTPLHVAAAWGRLSVVKLLVEHGGDVFSKDEDENTPLDYATQEHHVCVAKFLKNTENDQCSLPYSPDKYTMHLDKIIVNNGIVEGEYIPAELPKVDAFKKSEFISEWFSRSPTIKHNIFYEEPLETRDTPVNERSKPSSSLNIPCESDDDNSSKDNHLISNYVNFRRRKITQNLDASKQSSLYKSCLASFNELQKSLLDNRDIQQLDKLNSSESEKSSTSDHSLSGITPIEFTKTSYNQLFSVFLKNGSLKSPQQLEASNKILKEKNSHPSKSVSSVSSKSLSDFQTCELLKENAEQSTILTSHRSDKSYDNQADCSSSEESILSECLNKALKLSENFIDDSKISPKEIATENKSHISTISSHKAYLNNASGVSVPVIINETLASIVEEYKYEDTQVGVALIEKRFLPTPIPVTIEPGNGSVISIASSASSLPMSLGYDTDNLRNELTTLGVTIGPITKSTKRVYLNRLKKLRKLPKVQLTKVDKTYSVELEKTFRDETWNHNLAPYVSLERQIATQFAQPDPNKKWREGITKTSFTYLLLDPRITDNLPCRSETIPRPEIWRNFIDSIFYIGKGKRSRPYSHLYQAVTQFNTGQMKSDDKKIQHILDIWNQNSGVICLHIYQNVIPVEAYTREAAMIEVIGLKNLKNIKPGNYYGVVSTWNLKQKKLLGVYLLYKAMLIFLSEGERQLRPADIIG